MNVSIQERRRQYHAISNPNRIYFQGKRLQLNENPRTNVCSQCGKSYPEDLSEQTILHHTKYDPDNPLENTIEVCRGCHRKFHKTSNDAIPVAYRSRFLKNKPLCLSCQNFEPWMDEDHKYSGNKGYHHHCQFQDNYKNIIKICPDFKNEVKVR